MKHIFGTAIALAAIMLTDSAIAQDGAASSAPEQPATVEVMVLGSYHFANPGLDKANVEVGNVLTPRRQAELENLSTVLAGWAPTRILVESISKQADLRLSDYDDFSPAMLAERRNETVQVGYRLAHRLDHDAVYGFDEQPDEEGEPDYFPFGPMERFARDNGMGNRIDRFMVDIQAEVAAMAQGAETRTIPADLIQHNDPQKLAAGHAKYYYGVLGIGAVDEQPGAELNAYWYMRNAKMFAKLTQVAEPGDRVLLIVGSGHAYWLRHFAETTPGYTLVDIRPYLIAANAMSRAE